MNLRTSPDAYIPRVHRVGFGLATIFAPIAAASLLVAGSVVGGVGAIALQALIVAASLLLLVLSIPFAAFVVFRNRRLNLTQAKLAIGGLATSLLICALVLIGMAKVNAQAESLRKSIEERESQQPGTSSP